MSAVSCCQLFTLSVSKCWRVAQMATNDGSSYFVAQEHTDAIARTKNLVFELPIAQWM